MSLDKVLAISGKPGLFKLVAQSRGGFVVESLVEKKRFSVSVQQSISVLSEIAIYTLTEEVPLKEVFAKIKEKENGQLASISPKDNVDKLEEYFFDILPNYDEERVYASDIKKVIQWYNLLQQNNLLGELSSESEEVLEPVEEVVTEEKVAKKAPSKKKSK